LLISISLVQQSLSTLCSIQMDIYLPDRIPSHQGKTAHPRSCNSRLCMPQLVLPHNPQFTYPRPYFHNLCNLPSIPWDMVPSNQWLDVYVSLGKTEWNLIDQVSSKSCCRCIWIFGLCSSSHFARGNRHKVHRKIWI